MSPISCHKLNTHPDTLIKLFILHSFIQLELNLRFVKNNIPHLEDLGCANTAVRLNQLKGLLNISKINK